MPPPTVVIISATVVKVAAVPADIVKKVNILFTAFLLFCDFILSLFILGFVKPIYAA